MGGTVTHQNLLGTYLKDRRAKLDPAALGFPQERRRTPGLRREEVAQRAYISPTWYTWLEKGRGGAPSAGGFHRFGRGCPPPARTRAGCPRAEPRSHQDRYVGRGRVDPGGDRDAHGLWSAAAR